MKSMQEIGPDFIACKLARDWSQMQSRNFNSGLRIDRNLDMSLQDICAKATTLASQAPCKGRVPLGRGTAAGFRSRPRYAEGIAGPRLHGDRPGSARAARNSATVPIWHQFSSSFRVIHATHNPDAFEVTSRGNVRVLSVCDLYYPLCVSHFG